MRPWRFATALLGVGLLCAPAFAAGQAAPPAYENGPAGNDVLPGPGTINYVEGAVYLDGQPLGKNSVGSTQMEAGQVLQTHEGKAEILLNPGIYLRVDDHSEVKMISPFLTPTKVAVLRGEAGVEVDQLLKQNVVQVIDHGVTTQLAKTGYYEFNANHDRVKVFKGQAEVEYASNKWAKVKGDHEMALLPGEKEKAVKFHPDQQEDPLMAWSKLRSQYLAEANQQMAPEFYGPGFYPGWYWNPYMWNYTFIGGPFMSPFGWGFYPLGWGWGGLGWGGFYGHGFYHAPGRAGFYGHSFRGGEGFRGGTTFRGGAGMGFRGGAGMSFHGGGRG